MEQAVINCRFDLNSFALKTSIFLGVHRNGLFSGIGIRIAIKSFWTAEHWLESLRIAALYSEFLHSSIHLVTASIKYAVDHKYLVINIVALGVFL